MSARGSKGKRLSRWIVGVDHDQGASVEIAGSRDPGPALPSPPRLLVERDQPIAFDDIGVGKDVGIGRAGPLDDPDPGQNSDPAARSVSIARGPISK